MHIYIVEMCVKCPSYAGLIVLLLLHDLVFQVERIMAMADRQVEQDGAVAAGRIVDAVILVQEKIKAVQLVCMIFLYMCMRRNEKSHGNYNTCYT